MKAERTRRKDPYHLVCMRAMRALHQYTRAQRAWSTFIGCTLCIEEPTIYLSWYNMGYKKRPPRLFLVKCKSFRHLTVIFKCNINQVPRVQLVQLHPHILRKTDFEDIWFCTLCFYQKCPFIFSFLSSYENLYPMYFEQR